MSDGVRALTEAEAMNRESERRKARVRAERRERIATAIYASLLLVPVQEDIDREWEAVSRANRLMASLDAAEARDGEATK